QIILKNGSKTFDKWENLPPITMNFYFFEITNGDDFKIGKKPHLLQRGPYVFEEIRRKKIINITDDGKQITYQELKSFKFKKHASNGSLDDEISVLNIPAVSAPVVLKKTDPQRYPFAVQILNGIMKESGEVLVMKRKVKELLFDGYEVVFIVKLKEWAKKNPQFNVTVPGLPDDKFGFFYKKNCTLETQNCLDDFVFTINSGIQKPENVGMFQLLNGSEYLKFWEGKECNKLGGTDGTRFHPSVTRKETLEIFNIDACRSLPLVFDTISSVKGIDLLRFSPAKQFYEAPNNNSLNRCYCVWNDSNACIYNGLVDLSRCQRLAPILASQAHFYGVSKEIKDRVVGLNPNRELHESFVSMEPITGLTMNAARRGQINVDMPQVEQISMLKDVSPAVVPIMWFDEQAIVDDASARQFKDEVQTKIRYGVGILITVIIVGIVLILTAIALI
ncbi:platelet glycoprotein 4-like protein, partial [Dinothrombium tinctorium]